MGILTNDLTQPLTFITESDFLRNNIMPNILTAIVAQSRRDFSVGLEEEFLCGHTSWFFFEIGIHSMQEWTTTTRHKFAKKRSSKRLKHTSNLFRKSFRKSLHVISVC